jgi:hypothetical protein
VVGRDQHLQKQPAEQRREDLHGQMGGKGVAKCM